MAIEVLLPKLGLTMQEGTIDSWLVQPGQAVAVGDLLMVIETDKVNAEVEAEGSGIFQPAVEAGAVLPAGAVVGWLLAEGEAVPAGTSPAAAPPAAEPTAGGESSGAAAAPAPATPPDQGGDGGRRFVSPNARRVAGELSVDLARVSGSGPGGRVVSEDVEEQAEALRSRPVAEAAASPAVQSNGAQVLGLNHSPLVRRDAERMGVDLSSLAGTGPGGRITRADVVAAAQGRAEGGDLSAASTTTVVPLTGMRGAIARNMTASLQEMAQLTHGFEVDVTDLLALRAQVKEQYAGTDQLVPSVNDFIVAASARALAGHPMLNASVRDDGIHLLGEVHMGLAVALPDGLVVPVIRHADQLTVTEIAQETRALAAAARSGSLTLDQMEGATFAVTSLGSLGVSFFTPVINPGNTGILGVGQARDGVAWDGDVPRRRNMLPLSLTFDHRAVDGAPAAEYLKSVAALLEAPLRLMS